MLKEGWRLLVSDVGGPKKVKKTWDTTIRLVNRSLTSGRSVSVTIRREGWRRFPFGVS